MTDPTDQGSHRGISRRIFVASSSAAIAAGALPTGASASARIDETPAPAIPKRPFGRTGAEISIVGLGAGSRFYGPIPDDEQAGELVRQAIDRGIEFMETSANYGPDGISERRIGLAMKTHRSKVFLETKVDERDYDGAMREMERSLKRLQTDRLDLVLHHFLRSRDEFERVAAKDGAEMAIRKMIDEGVVRFHGYSTHLPDMAMLGMEMLEPDAIQLPINAVRVPDFEPEVLPAAQDRGIAIIAMKTCGNGFFNPANATTPDRIEQFGPPPGAWDRWDVPTWNEYIHYVLSLPVAAATIGIDSYFTLDGVVAAATLFEPLPATRLASIHERARVFETTGYWIPRA